MALLRDGERTAVERARGDATAPGRSTASLDAALLGRQATAVAVRTVAVDQAVRAAANPQLVVLGAGLDGRAWRMPELSRVEVFEVDRPASQLDKRERAASLHPTARSVRFVPADIAHSELGAALGTAGHRASTPTTWVLEGVIPYLTSADAAMTVAAVTRRSAPGSQVVVSYQTGSPGGVASRTLARALLAFTGRGDPMAHEPRRSSWTAESVRTMLTDAGLHVAEDRGLTSLASDLALPCRHVRTSRLVIAVTPADCR
jgi:methyltransferase (TIGR00027 family)